MVWNEISPFPPCATSPQSQAMRRKVSAERCLSSDLPFSCKPAAESALRFYTISLRWDCQLQRLFTVPPVSTTGHPSWSSLRHSHGTFWLCESPRLPKRP